MSTLFTELKRRNVFRVGAAYLALGWVVTQVAATIGPAMNLPSSLIPVLVWTGVLGFPFVLLFSWVYELTPEGLKREHEVERTDSITHATAKKLDSIVIALLVLAIGLFVFDRFSPRASVPAAPAIADAEPVPSPPATPAAPAAVVVNDNSIAVLPFVNMSSDKEQEYFSDGLSEELLNLLAQVPELRVIARTSSFSFKGKDVDIATIAKQLNVANILEGSVRRAGNTLRVTAQLVRASDSSHLWSKTFDREMSDVFKVQDEIAGEVVGALKLKLLPVQQPAGARPRTANAEAYNKYLLGRQYNNRERPEAWLAAVGAFEDAIRLDPDYAAAYAALAIAETYASDYRGGSEANMAGKRRAVTAAEKAVALDPNLADAYTARSVVRSSIDWNWVAAQEDFERALALDPGDAVVQRRYSLAIASMGRFAESLPPARRSVELDPLAAPAWNNLANALWINGDLAGAREALNRALAINPESDYALVGLATLDLLEGKPEAARANFEKTSAFWVVYGRAMVEHALGHEDKARQALDELVATQALVGAYQIAEIYAWRGEKDKAFEWLDRAATQRDGGLSVIKPDVLMNGLHDDPRYAALLQKIGLPL